MKHLVIIGLVIPEPNSTAAGHRMLQLMQLFQEFGYKITFLTASNNLEFSTPIKVKKIELNNSNFDQLIKDLKPDIVLFDRYISEEQFGWRVAENCPNAIKILDTEDLHFLREARRKAFFEKKEINKKDLINDVFKREIASILRCDLSLIISQFEYDLLINQFNINPEILFYIPFISKENNEKLVGFSDRKHFVSIGNFLHEPNWQTVLKLKSFWKSIREKITDAELHIYGAYASNKVLQLHNEKEGFLVKGRAGSVKKVFSEARVLLAPIPFGAGLKGKIWESMIYGLPNVTTYIGAEAMHDNLPWNGFITDKEDDFINQSIELYLNEKIWNESQKKGTIILKTIFNHDRFTGSFIKKIEFLMGNLDHHRLNNYLGFVLSQQQLNATKYMSRWIEEKNKKSCS